MKIISFHGRNKDAVEEKRGEISISEKTGVKILEGDEQFKAFIEREIIPGIESIPDANGIIHTLHPEDGEEFINRILRKYSGSRFWAHAA
jgi:hypothetical protein